MRVACHFDYQFVMYHACTKKMCKKLDKNEEVCHEVLVHSYGGELFTPLNLE